MKVGFIHTHICVHFCVNKTKGFALSLALKQRRKAVQKATLIVIVDNIVIMIMAGSLRYPPQENSLTERINLPPCEEKRAGG